MDCNRGYCMGTIVPGLGGYNERRGRYNGRLMEMCSYCFLL
jgi:hypothetical protein